MKKFLLLAMLFGAAIFTKTYAQAGDPPSMLQQIKDKIKQPMMEQTGLTEAQVDRVIEINYEMRETMRGFAHLNEADRASKVAELKAARDKKYTEIPLTEDQIAAVKTFYENMGKHMPKKN